jgi:hypothetical protein
MAFRLLGKCPTCFQEDTIVVRRAYQTKPSTFCDSCRTDYGDWLGFYQGEKEKGNRLIPVEVVRSGNYTVEARWPMIGEFPFKDLVVSTLNAALMTRFGLEVCVCCEGGVQRRGVRGFELRNTETSVGLTVEDYGLEYTGKTLSFYERMLRQLLEYNLCFGGITFRRGELLWLDENEENRSNASILLFGTLANIGGSAFAKRVFKRKDQIDRDPFLRRHIRGLSDEDIAQLFNAPRLERS